MQFVELRSTIVEKIRRGLPALRTCRSHAGPETYEGLVAISSARPALLVNLLGQSRLASTSGVATNTRVLYATLDFAAYIITGGRQNPPSSAESTELAATSPDINAANLANALIFLITMNDFDLAYAQAVQPKTIRSEAIYPSSDGHQSISLWAVRWQQTITLTQENQPNRNTALLSALQIQGSDSGRIVKKARAHG